MKEEDFHEKLKHPYLKLRSWTDIDSCECAEVTGLVLFDCLTDNPIHCARCKNEVDPERLGLSVEEVESVARWHSVARSLYRLWLDSGEYENYAKARLLDLSGQVNQDGMKIARMLSCRLPTWFWLFRDADGDLDYQEAVNCPICMKPLNKDVAYGMGKCLECHILV